MGGQAARSPELLRGFVFDRATVRLCLWRGDGFACQGLIQRRLNIVCRAGNIGWIRCRLAVDCSFVGDFSIWIDYHHMGRVLGAISPPGFAFGVEKQRRLMRLPRSSDL